MASITVVDHADAEQFDAVVFVERRRVTERQDEQIRMSRTASRPYYTIRFASSVVGPSRQSLEDLAAELREIAEYVRRSQIRSLLVVALEHVEQTQELEFETLVGMFTAAFEELELDITIQRPD